MRGVRRRPGCVVGQPGIAGADAGMVCDLGRDHQLAVVLLGELLEPAGHVDSVADSGEIDAGPVTHAPHHGMTDVDADAHSERFPQLVGQLAAQLRHALHQAARGRQGLAGAHARSGVHAEEGHDPVARELVGDPAGALDDRARDLEVAVEHEHHVVRQPRLRQTREPAHVRE